LFRLTLARPLFTPLLKGKPFCRGRHENLGASRFVWLCPIDVAQTVNISLVVEASFLIEPEKFAFLGYPVNDPTVVVIVIRVAAMTYP
jgi:hypothetical protein